MMKITRFGILKMALFMGLYGAFIGLIGAIIILLAGMLFASLTDSFPLLAGSFNWLNFLEVVLFYGAGGFLVGLIFTPIVNLILKIIHGIDLDIEMAESRQPQQYSAQ